MKRILLICFMLLSALVTESWAQDRTVSGTVKDESGESLPGVNIILKGTTTGATSDIDGNWQLSVPSEGGTLVFQFVGMATQEIAVGSRSVIDVVMAADAKQLAEVVVTAAQIERQKRALGYGVETVSGESVQQVSEPDALRAIQGKIAGVNITGSSSAPGSATRITIRGNSSLLGNNQPLFIVDGIPYNNNTNKPGDANRVQNNNDQLTGGGSFGSRISDLDPNNIESINVLKGAAASALYGARAANGVVIITTKTGSSKVSRKGLEVGLNLSYSIENPANLPDYQNTYGTGTDFGYQQVNGSWGAPFVGTRDYATVTEIPHWYDGRAGMEEFWGTTVPYQAYPNNVKDFFDTGKLWETSVSISGGNENSVMSMVVSNTDHSGITPNTSFNRFSASVGGNSTLENGIIISGNLQYTRTKQHSFQGGANNAVGNGSAFARTLYLGRNWDLQGQPYQNPVTLGSEFFVARSQADNPYWSVENAGIDSETNRINSMLSIGYDITDWLNLKYFVGINQYSQRSIDYFRPGSRGASGSGQVNELNNQFLEISHNFLTTINKKLTDDIGLTAILGLNANEQETRDQAVLGVGYVDFYINDLDNTVSQVANLGGFYEERLIGVFADLSFDYKNWLFLNVTGRNDWSSTLPKANRSFFYPSVSTSFIFTDALDISSNVLSSGKIRASYAQVGAATLPYQITPIFFLNANGLTSGQPGATSMPFNGTASATLQNQARDPNLKPERTNEIEFGLQLGFFNDRINIDATVYDRRTIDQIISIQTTRATGFSSFLTNIGEVSNKGVELGLDVTPVQLDNGFRWNMYFAYTHNNNVVENLENDIIDVDEVTLMPTFSGSVSAVHIAGQQFGLLRGSVSARDQDGNLLIDPASGQLISATSPDIIGNPNPDFIIGFTNTFSWKGFTLSAVIDWKQGGDMYSVTNLSMLGRGVTKDTEDRETPQVIPGVYGNPITEEPLIDPETGETIPNTTIVDVNTLWFGNSFAINGQDEWSVWDATVIRLREVTLSYELPKKALDKTPFGTAKLSVSGRNLWYSAPNFPKASNFDPEVNTFGSSNAQGLEFTSSPSVRRFGVNLSLTF